ncbi:MAG TPA: hypothetical protein VM012_04375 [Flavitalea sp.]|nr:hypothetical protein [Flavitalea sp.]
MRSSFYIVCILLVCCNDQKNESANANADTTKTVSPHADSLAAEKNPDTAFPSGSLRAADNPHWKKKKDEGVHFFVVGNEPFWSLELRNQQRVNFRLSDWQSDSVIAVTTSFQSGKKNEIVAKEFRLFIIPGKCSDGMSDFIYDYQVEVFFKGVRYKGCGIDLTE